MLGGYSPLPEASRHLIRQTPLICASAQASLSQAQHITTHYLLAPTKSGLIAGTFLSTTCLQAQDIINEACCQRKFWILVRLKLAKTSKNSILSPPVRSSSQKISGATHLCLLNRIYSLCSFLPTFR